MSYFNLFICVHNEKLSRRHREGREKQDDTREHKADSALTSVNPLITRPIWLTSWVFPSFLTVPSISFPKVMCSDQEDNFSYKDWFFVFVSIYE